MSGETDLSELIDPDAHEPVTEAAWDADRARAAVAAIVSETEASFDPDGLWPPHPLDEEDDEPPLERVASLYLGAAGVIWALHALDGPVSPRRGGTGSDVALTLPERYRAEPDFPIEGVVPSLWMGEAGILLVAHTLAPGRLAGGAAARRRARERRQPVARVQLGVAGDDARRRRHVRANAATSAGGQPGPSPPTASGANGAATSGSRTSTGAARTSSGRRTGSRATSSSSHAATFWTTSGVPRSRPGPWRRSTATRCAPTGSRSGVPRSSRAASRAARSGVTVHRASSRRSRSLAPGDDALTELLVAGGELTWRAGPLREGRRPLPRHRRQRLRVPEALRAHRRRALARIARAHSRCTRSSRSSARPQRTAAGGTRSGPAIPAPRSTSRAASPQTRPSPRWTSGDRRPRAVDARLPHDARDRRRSTSAASTRPSSAPTWTGWRRSSPTASAGGASVSYMAPFSHGRRARAVRVLGRRGRGRDAGCCSLRSADDEVVGTVQVVFAAPPNQPHRADIAKLLVHRSARRLGVAQRLMEHAEAEARSGGQDAARPRHRHGRRRRAPLHERLGLDAGRRDPELRALPRRAALRHDRVLEGRVDPLARRARRGRRAPRRRVPGGSPDQGWYCCSIAQTVSTWTRIHMPVSSGSKSAIGFSPRTSAASCETVIGVPPSCAG